MQFGKTLSSISTWNAVYGIPSSVWIRFVRSKVILCVLKKNSYVSLFRYSGAAVVSGAACVGTSSDCERR